MDALKSDEPAHLFVVANEPSWVVVRFDIRDLDDPQALTEIRSGLLDDELAIQAGEQNHLRLTITDGRAEFYINDDKPTVSVMLEEAHPGRMGVIVFADRHLGLVRYDVLVARSPEW